MRYTNTSKNWIVIVALLVFNLPPVLVTAQTQTVGLFLNDSSSFNGYTLFAPASYKNTYLIDNEGRLVQSWVSVYEPGQSAYLLENGDLLRTGYTRNSTFTAGGAGGIVQEFDWDGNLIWEFEYSSNQYLQHHDIEKLPNGNVLILAWEYKSFADAISGGRNPSLMSQNELWPDHIIEVQPDGSTGGNIVWEWHIWDHLIQNYDSTKSNYGIIADHPELIDLNFVAIGTGADWNHSNAVNYNEKFDQIVISVHNFNEIWVIDHSTTTEEAAGHTGGNSGMGGDLLYRWGNPQTYDAGDVSDQKLFVQHDSHWIESGIPGEGNILIFNNGGRRPGGNYSSIDEIVPPVDSNGYYYLAPGSAYGPEEPIWTYTAEIPTDFYAQNISGSQRQANGNTLICDGPHGTFFEVTPDTDIVWLYINPVINTGPMTQGDPIPVQQNRVFRAYRYAPDYPGFDGKDLTPGDPIEIYPTNVKEINPGYVPEQFELFQNYPNPFNPVTTISFSIPTEGNVSLKIFNVIGQEIVTLVNENLSVGSYSYKWNAKDRSNGVYFYKLVTDSFSETRKMILLK